MATAGLYEHTVHLRPMSTWSWRHRGIVLTCRRTESSSVLDAHLTSYLMRYVFKASSKLCRYRNGMFMTGSD